MSKARWGDDSIMPCRIPEYARCVNEARPDWYVMENVPAAPAPETPDYHLVSRIWNNRWSGGEQHRERRFTFGSLSPASFHIEGVALEAVGYVPAVISTGQAGKGGPRSSVEAMAIAQGLDPARFENSPFTTTELRRAIANGVPLPMGRAVAAAVCRAIGFVSEAAPALMAAE
jgi:DNA (cytosine-5)-methyltransferase 1